jgi:hypothetical protein
MLIKSVGRILSVRNTLALRIPTQLVDVLVAQSIKPLHAGIGFDQSVESRSSEM